MLLHDDRTPSVILRANNTELTCYKTYYAHCINFNDELLHSGLRSREQMLEMHTLRAALMEISGDSVQGGTISARMNNIENKVTTLEGATQLNTLAAKKVLLQQNLYVLTVSAVTTIDHM
jgi:hypothetical protein